MTEIIRFIISRRVCEEVLRSMPAVDLNGLIAFVAAEAEHLVFSEADILELHELGEQGDHRIGREMFAIALRAKAYALGLEEACV